MPILTNVKREAFCGFLMRGMTQVEAHAKAGYRANKANANILFKSPEIQQRLVELREERKEMSLAIRTEEERMFAEEAKIEEEEGYVSKRWLLLQLRENLKLARELANIPAANKALDQIATLSGYGAPKNPGGRPPGPKTVGLPGDDARPVDARTKEAQVLDTFADDISDGLGDGAEPEPDDNDPSVAGADAPFADDRIAEPAEVFDLGEGSEGGAVQSDPRTGSYG